MAPSRQSQYQRRRRAGRKQLKPALDPVELVDLLRAAGIRVEPSLDPAALAQGIELLVERFSLGEISLQVDSQMG